jgi:nucleotide-binding universal stress UspA family protein
MDIVVAVLIWAAIVVISMIAIAYLATKWGRDAFGWVLLAAVLGPIALIALLGTRQSDLEKPRQAESRGERAAGIERTVLVAADGSAPAKRAAAYVAEIHDEGSEALLLTVMPHESKPAAGGTSDEHERAIETAVREPRSVLEAAGVPVRVSVAYGSPGEEIVRCAAAEDAELIVMGRKGRGLSKALLGSVSDYVSKHAKQPVALFD